jgi:hypothetical protein
MFQEKNKNKNKILLLLFLFLKIQVQWDPRIVVIDDGYAAALIGLKCFKEIIYIYIYLMKFSSSAGPMPSRR